MKNITEGERKAWHEGYEMGKFSGVMDATDGLAAVKGYTVRAVVLCKNCEYKEKAKVNSKGFLICPTSGMEITDGDYCSYGEPRKSLYKTDDWSKINYETY